MELPYIDKDCRYYHGEEDCPYTDCTQALLWHYEATYNEAVSMEDSSHLLDSSMDLYACDGLDGFAKDDGTSFSFKSCLYLLYKRDHPEATTDQYKQWYLECYKAK